MLITAVRASRAAARHMLQEHGVELWELEESLVGVRSVRRTREGRYACDVRTPGGRRLRVVFRTTSKGREVTAQVVTAFPL